ncbi:MAG TPA: succinate dehydrogenase cytochrome b subunit, partial [Planctomycetia bacterium]|nr:succinate dehydrogenase cytochrome b subunit [Planctomycetia bacterium]
AYGQKLRDTGPLLWLVRLGLLGLLALHVLFTVQLVIENRRARPQGYLIRKSRASTWASRTMIFTGLLVLAFLIYHILHFTVLATNPQYAKMVEVTKLGEKRHDVYAMVTDAFSRPLVVLVYIGAMLLVFTHLSHGVKSLLQTLGLSTSKLWPIWRKAGPIAAGLLVAGFLLAPLGVYFEFVRPAPPADRSTKAKTVQPVETKTNEKDQAKDVAAR